MPLHGQTHISTDCPTRDKIFYPHNLLALFTESLISSGHMIRGGMFNPSTVSGMLVLLSALAGCGENESGQETHYPSTDDAAQVVRDTEDIAPAVKDGFVTSAVCRECHQREHASWHASYHRTMTQEVNAKTIRGNFDGEIHTVSGYLCMPFKTV